MGELDAGADEGAVLGAAATLLDVDGAAVGVLALDGVEGCGTTVLALCCLPDEQPASRPNTTTATTERFTNTARSLPADAR